MPLPSLPRHQMLVRGGRGKSNEMPNYEVYRDSSARRSPAQPIPHSADRKNPKKFPNSHHYQPRHSHLYRSLRRLAQSPYTHRAIFKDDQKNKNRKLILICPNLSPKFSLSILSKTVLRHYRMRIFLSAHSYLFTRIQRMRGKHLSVHGECDEFRVVCGT